MTENNEKVEVTKSQNIHEILKLQDGSVVILPEWTKQHLADNHTVQGKGSIFNPDINYLDIIRTKVGGLSSAQIGEGGIISFEVENIGYELIVGSDKIQKLQIKENMEVEKNEGNNVIIVPGVKVTNNIHEFSTNSFSIVIRPTALEYIPEELLEDQFVKNALGSNKVFSILSGWPGKDLPKASEWNGQYTVVQCVVGNTSGNTAQLDILNTRLNK